MLVGNNSINGEDEPAGRIGCVALAQARLDEWLVQVLISLLKPLRETRVQLLVGDRSLGSRRILLKKLAGQVGISLDSLLSCRVLSAEVLADASSLSKEHGRVVNARQAGDHRGHGSPFGTLFRDIG